MKTILLLDNSIVGHKYAFAKLFCKYLLRLNYKVILVLPEKTEQIKEELTESEPEIIEHLFPINLSVNQISKIRIHKKIDPAFNAFLLWLATKRLVKAVEKKSKQQVDVVFFCWLDNYVTNYLPYILVDLVFPYQWAGLYFHPWYLFNTNYNNVSISSQDNVLRAKRCIGCGVHDETLRVKLKNRVRKPVLYFPEIADGSSPMKNFEVTEALKEKANGKPIIGLIGLAKRKGVLHLLDVIGEDVDQQFFYFLAGKVPYEQYSLQEQERIKKIIVQQPDNVYYYPDYIPEGSAINSLISAFSIVYLVYNNFKSSSNFLTKAAIFKKLAVGINSYWIGENIQKYDLGLTVKGENPSETLQALRKISQKEISIHPKWDKFLGLNGEKYLYSTFRELLDAVY